MASQAAVQGGAGGAQGQQLGANGNGMYGSSYGGRAGASAYPNLPRQASIYTLTLDEFQNAISEHGQKPNFGSMNMDEFLKSVWTAEESQAMAAALAAGADQQQMGLMRQASMERQNSLTLPRTLSRKTVDEVWRDIAAGPEAAGGLAQRQATFGEMTLEDFLVKAGVVREDMAPAPGKGMEANGSQATTSATLAAIQNAANQRQAEWINFQLSHAAIAQQQQQQMLQQQAEAAAAFASAHKRAPAGALTIAIPALAERNAVSVADAQPLSPTSTDNGVTTALAGEDTPRGKKRAPGEVVEKVVERRQRRMIKNRESAARSRARKQAYTVELEAEITMLKDDNVRLKNLLAMEEERRRKLAMETIAPRVKQNKDVNVKPVLRRCRTGPW